MNSLHSILFQEYRALVGPKALTMHYPLMRKASKVRAPLTESQILFSHPARPNLVNKYFIMTNWETNFLEVLACKAVRFCRASCLFPARSCKCYGPRMGLSSMVLQRKRSQGRMGHMIIMNMSGCKFYLKT